MKGVVSVMCGSQVTLTTSSTLEEFSEAMAETGDMEGITGVNVKVRQVA